MLMGGLLVSPVAYTQDGATPPVVAPPADEPTVAAERSGTPAITDSSATVGNGCDPVAATSDSGGIRAETGRAPQRRTENQPRSVSDSASARR